jgi:hypothetical protein
MRKVFLTTAIITMSMLAFSQTDSAQFFFQKGMKKKLRDDAWSL